MRGIKVERSNHWLRIQFMLWAFFACVPLLTAAPEDAELKRLEAQLDNAMTQGDMNFAARELAQHWDARLAQMEKKIEGKLDKRERKEFRKSKKRWRSYRAKEVTLRASFFEGGSIQPLISEGAYSEITEHRLLELESLLDESLTQRSERDDSTAPPRVIKRNGWPEFYFLPCSTNASVSFEGETQMGRGTHRLEVRRLAYTGGASNNELVTQSSCIIYYTGDEYGPSILRTIDECLDPLVRKMPNDVVEVYYLAGAHSHFRQRWKLIGWSAELQKEEAIDWDEDPRNQAK